MPSKLKDPTTLSTAAYAAGLFDGEGCVGAVDNRSPKRPTHSYKFRAQLSMTDKSAIEFLVRNFGGYYHVELTSRRKFALKNIYAWRCGKQESLRFFRTIIDFSITKKLPLRFAIAALQLPVYKRKYNRERALLFKAIRFINSGYRHTYETPADLIELGFENGS